MGVSDIKDLLNGFILRAEQTFAKKDEVKEALQKKADRKVEKWIVAIVGTIITAVVLAGLDRILN